jgi:hypothetical protein
MKSENEDFIDLCELIGSISVPFLFFHAVVTISTNLPVDELIQLLLIPFLMYVVIKTGPLIGSFLALLVLLIEDN